MIKILVTLATYLLFQSPIKAADDDLNIDPLAGISVSKEDILKSMEALKKQGKISDADFETAKKELMGMSDAQIGNITETAVQVIRKDPDKAVGLVSGKVDKAAVMKEAESVKAVPTPFVDPTLIQPK